MHVNRSRCIVPTAVRASRATRCVALRRVAARCSSLYCSIGCRELSFDIGMIGAVTVPRIGLVSIVLVALSCGRIDYDPLPHNPLRRECSGIAGGDHDGTRINANQRIELDDTISGVYTSVVCDLGADSTPVLLRAVPRAPYQKRIPTQSESGYEQASVSTSGLAGLWRLNATNLIGLGQTIVDSTGFGFVGTVVGSGVGNAIEPQTGLFGPSAYWDGMGGHRVDFGDEDVLDFGVDSFSFGLWVFVDQAVGDFDMPLYKGGSSAVTSGYDIELGRSNWGGHIGDGTTNVGGRFGALDDFRGAWTHLFIVVDRQSQEMYTYANANRVDTDPIAAIGSVSSSRQFTFGAHDNGTHPFGGRMDEISVWRKALTEGEIEELYRRGALRIRYQVRTCATRECIDNEPFVGPDGTSATFYSELMNETNETPVFDLTENPSLANGPYFQWKAFFQTADVAISPELSNVFVEVE